MRETKRHARRKEKKNKIAENDVRGKEEEEHVGRKKDGGREGTQKERCKSQK